MAKQVIVIRRDLKMRRGKEIAQGSHASAMWLVDAVTRSITSGFAPRFNDHELSWVKGLFKKIVCQVETEEQLVAIYDKALEAGLLAKFVTDEGLTEFHRRTITAVAIGPNDDEMIDAVTGNLKLY